MAAAEAPTSPPPPLKQISKRAAHALLGTTPQTPFREATRLWGVRRKSLERQGDAGRPELVRLDAAYRLLQPDFQ